MWDKLAESVDTPDGIDIHLLDDGSQAWSDESGPQIYVEANATVNVNDWQ